MNKADDKIENTGLDSNIKIVKVTLEEMQKIAVKRSFKSLIPSVIYKN
jgi:hypothetical protein